MEKADCTLEEYINQDRDLNTEHKLWFVNKIVSTMAKVHDRGIIHRDLSPNNILKVGEELKLSDFGLGKNTTLLHSHQTRIDSQGTGQYLYCAPEQLMALREGDERGDVYSLGKIINFIFTNNSASTDHVLKGVSEKATVKDPKNRYQNAREMYDAIQIFEEIKRGDFSKEVEVFLYELSSEDICKYLIENRIGFYEALLKVMKIDLDRGNQIMNSIENYYQDYIRKINGRYEDWDPYANFSYGVLNEINPEFSYPIKEKAARILRYVAKVVNRFSAQGMIEDLKNRGIEPEIESILG